MSEVVDHLRRQGEDDAADVLSELAVDELDRDYTVDDVTAVVAQLLRAAVAHELREVERELRGGDIAPDVAMATITRRQGTSRAARTAQSHDAGGGPS